MEVGVERPASGTSPLATAGVRPRDQPREDDARVRAGFAAASWSGPEVEDILRSGCECDAEAPSTSPGVNRSAEAFHASLCDDVEAEMARQSFASQAAVARGIEPITGPFASKAGVVMTGQSIITVGAFTFAFCGLIAKAFHRTIMLDPTYWQSDRFTSEGASHLLRDDLPLVRYWTRIFMSFAISGQCHGPVRARDARRAASRRAGGPRDGDLHRSARIRAP